MQLYIHFRVVVDIYDGTSGDILFLTVVLLYITVSSFGSSAASPRWSFKFILPYLPDVLKYYCWFFWLLYFLRYFVSNSAFCIPPCFWFFLSHLPDSVLRRRSMLNRQRLDIFRCCQIALRYRQVYIYCLFYRLLAARKLKMAKSKQQQQVSTSANNNIFTSKVDNQLSPSNIGNDVFDQSTTDFASLLEIPLFNELMLVYEIQYNATKDALKHFLEEQPNLIFPLFTNVLWSLLVNPLLAMQVNPITNLNLSPEDLSISTGDLQKIAGEMLDKAPNNSMQNLINAQQRNQRMHDQLNNHSDKRARSIIHRTENQKNNSITCNVCAKPLKNRAAFVKHRRRHLGISELAFACGTCDKRCSERRHLAVHCKNKHHEMPSVSSQPDLRSNQEQDTITLNDSKEESPDSIPEINSMNEKVFVKLWQSDNDKNSIPNGTEMCAQF
ncbi:Telomere zinc finger-associated protein [Dirofilaria immitis]